MKKAIVLLAIAAQQAGYPITIVPPGKGPFTFPAGYQTPWDKIEIMVTAKMSPNLFVLHGSEGLDPAHPDAIRTVRGVCYITALPSCPRAVYGHADGTHVVGLACAREVAKCPRARLSISVRSAIQAIVRRPLS